MPQTITLKKYPNRRLYDTDQSTYVTLAQVAQMIKKGSMVQVIDVKTEEDVTSFILTQIILEQIKKDSGFLPVSLLHLIIQFGENVLKDFFETYLEKTIEGYLLYKRGMDEQFKAYLEMGMDFSSMAENMFKGMNPFQAFMENFPSKTKKNE